MYIGNVPAVPSTLSEIHVHDVWAGPSALYPLAVAAVAVVVVLLVVATAAAAQRRRQAAGTDARLCRACGMPHPPFARFCRRCGRAILGGPQ